MHSLQQSVTATTNCTNIVLRIQVDSTIKYIERRQIKSIPRNHATATSSSWFDSICLSWVRKAIIALYHSTIFTFHIFTFFPKTSQLTTRTINQTRSVIGANQSACFIGAGEECHPLLWSRISRRSNYIANWYGYTIHIPTFYYTIGDNRYYVIEWTFITLSVIVLLHYRSLFYTIGDNVITLSAAITLSVIITLSVVTPKLCTVHPHETGVNSCHHSWRQVNQKNEQQQQQPLLMLNTNGTPVNSQMTAFTAIFCFVCAAYLVNSWSELLLYLQYMTSY